ncbi:metallophosphoesterase [Aquamicrobium terrae]|uniref:Serine/threonine protein phosphatase 1 n=1 Tax=Aquamicrobium terrae TaxID=1324945 RepID=A0ABV2N521_9HYPH
MDGDVDLAHARAPQGLRLYAVGDVHGRLDLLEAFHRHVAAEIEADAPPDWRVVHLGDYTDRGPDSKGVLAFLAEAQARDTRNVLLAGNHDLGLLEFIDRPEPYGLFMTNGGIETAASYGVHWSRFGFPVEDQAALSAFHAALLAAMPPAHIDLLRSLTTSFACGDFFLCHAGVRPGIALERQSRDDLVWIRGEFHHHSGLYPKVIVHGHTPVAAVEVKPNRVNLDTGAYYTGRLSAMAVEAGDKRLLTITKEGVSQSSAAVTP